MADQKPTTMSQDVQERWLPIEGFPAYEISNHGRIRSYWRHIRKKKGRGFEWILDKYPQKILNPNLNKNGYPIVDLMKDEKRYSHRVHQLVLLTFIGPCPPGMQSCHNDGIRINNALPNLRYDSPTNNQLDRHKHGTANVGEKWHLSRLTDVQIMKIRGLYTQGFLQKDIAKTFGVASCTIFRIVHRKSWSHLP